MPYHSRHLVRTAHRYSGGIARRAVAAARSLGSNRSLQRSAARGVGKIVKRAYSAAKKRFSSKKKVRKTDDPVPGSAMSHSGINASNIKVGKRKLKLLKNQTTVGRWRYQQTYKGVIASAAGTQSLILPVSTLTVDKVLTSTGAAYTSTQSFTALTNLNPYLSAPVGPYLPAVATPFTDRFIVLNTALEFEFTSFSAVGAIVDVYVLTAKKTTNGSPVAFWNQGLLQQAEGQAAATIPNTPSVTGTVGYPSSAFVHCKPTESRLFKDFWHIDTVKTLYFTGNSTEKINIDFNVNKVIKRVDWLQYQAQSDLYIAGITQSIMLVARGAVVLDETPSITGGEQPTYGSCKIGYIVQEKYTMCGVKGNTGRLDVSTIYDNVPSSATLANQKVLLETDFPTDVNSSTVP